MSEGARKAFVVGWPIRHSRSPLIHRHWLARYGIPGDYVAEAVPPETIAAFLSGGFRENGYVGGNVTLPHKEAAYEAAQRRTGIAEELEAANTLWMEEGQLCADNTDAYGFAANLDQVMPAWREGRTALVIGAGGASRAVLFALLAAGYETVLLLNRTPARAETLAAHFGPRIVVRPLEEIEAAVAATDLVVNATSAGLHGGAALAVPWRAARAGAIATDLTYVPLVTPFLAEARAAGIPIADGLGMLLHQAVPGFERWFGVRPQVDAALRALVAADIGT